MTKGRILLVEDEGVVALDVEQRLAQLGYSVVGVADSAAVAIELVRAHTPELVLMDIRIRGGLDGVDLARELATRFEVPVVFLTGNADEATLRRAIEAEPYGYVLKPFDLRTLEAVIETALFRFRAERRVHDMQSWLSDTMFSLPNAVFTTDLQLRVTFLNRAAEALSGMALSTALQRPLAEVLGDEVLLAAAMATASRAKHEAAPRVERLTRQVGGAWFDVSVGPIFSDTRVEGVVVAFGAPHHPASGLS